MKQNDNPFDKYVYEEVGLAKKLRQSRTWVVIITVLVGVLAAIFFYKYIFIDKFSAKELGESIEIVWLDSKWVEKDVTPHSVKIVPAVTFKFKNVGSRPLQLVNFEGVFEFADSGRVHTDGVTQACRKPLKPGEVSEEVFIRAFFGYSASSKEAFLQNLEEWKKMKVKIFARSKGSGPAQIGDKFEVKQMIEGMEEQSDAVKARMKKDIDTVTGALKVDWQDSKWLDRKVTTGKVVILPSIRIKLKNISAEDLERVHLKGVFEFVDNGERLTEGLATLKGKGIPAGAVSEEVLIKGEFGYQATSKGAFFDNIKDWRSVRVNIFAKLEDTGYVFLKSFPIKKEIEGVKVIYRMQQKEN